MDIKITIDDDYKYIQIESTNPLQVYTYNDLYYVILPEGFLAFEVYEVPGDYEYTVKKGVEIPPHADFTNKIDLSIKLMDGYQIVFTQQPAVDSAISINDVNDNEPTGPTDTASPDIGADADVDGVVADNGTGTDDFDDDELDLILGNMGAMFIVSETQRMGVKISTYDIINNIKSLLNPTDNDSLNESQGNFLTCLNKIAEKYKENDTIGKILVNMKGLPTWITPEVVGSFKMSDNVSEKVQSDAFNITQTESGCNIDLDNVLPPLYTGYLMNTDRSKDLPGSWRKSHRDYTVNAIFKPTVNSNQKTKIKLPGNIYNTVIHLTDSAQRRVDESKVSKTSSIYSRILTIPKSIRSIDLELDGTSRKANITGLYMNDSSVSDKYIPLKCTDKQTHQSAIIDVLDKYYPSIDTVLKKHSELGKLSTNILPFLYVLKHYYYERNNITLDNYKTIGSIISNNLKPLEYKNWHKAHSALMLSKFIEPRLTDKVRPADDGKYQLCLELEEYLESESVKGNRSSLSLPDINKGTSVEPSVLSERAKLEPMLYDPVNGLLFQNNGKFYTPEEYKKQMRYELYSMMKANLIPEKGGMSCNTLELALKALEHYRLNSHKGILDNLKIKLSSDTKEPSATLNFLTSFDLRVFSDQLNYIRYLTNLIDNGYVRLEEDTKKYVLTNSKEIVCCQHVLEELKGNPINEFIDTEGLCIYCKALLDNKDQSDDFGQTQFTTNREMYTTGQDTTSDKLVEEATLYYFLEYAIKWLTPKLAQSGYLLSDTKTIIQDTIDYIKANNKESVQPYGSYNNSKPDTYESNDLRLAVIYDIKISNTKVILEKRQQNGKSSTFSTGALGNIIRYFGTVSNKTTTESVVDIKQIVQKFSKIPKECLDALYKPELAFGTLYNNLVMNKHIYNLSCLFAHINLVINTEYNDIRSLEYLLTDDNLFSICNEYQTYMTNILNRHIASLRKGDIRSQTYVMTMFDAYILFFKAKFYKDLFNIGFTSSQKADIMLNEKFTQIMTDLKIKNSYDYDRIQNGIEIGFAKYQTNYKMYQPNTSDIAYLPEKITNIRSYMEYWTKNQISATNYGQSLWEHYAAINDDIGSLTITSNTDATKKVITVESILNRDADMIEINTATFDAAACSSRILMVNSTVRDAEERANQGDVDGDEDLVINNYITNERELEFYVNSKPLVNFNKLDEELCTFGLTKPILNNSLQSNMRYYPSVCHSGQNMSDIILTQNDKDESIREQFTNELFINNFKMLLKYKKLQHYTKALGGEIFNTDNIWAKWLINVIDDGPSKTITNNEGHKLRNEGKYTLGLADTLKEPPSLKDIFPDAVDLDFPKLIKTQKQLSTEENDVINRRRIFRIQNNAKSLINATQWLNKELSEDDLEKLTQATSYSMVANLSGSTKYQIEKELASTDGYVLSELILFKGNAHRNKEPIIKYVPIMPEIYNMSYLEYTAVINTLSKEDIQYADYLSHAEFISVLYAAIRLDIILNIKSTRKNPIKAGFKIEDLEGINNTEISDKTGSKFLSQLKELIAILAKIKIDPDVAIITKLYELRSIEYDKSSRTRNDYKNRFAEGNNAAENAENAENDDADDAGGLGLGFNDDGEGGDSEDGEGEDDLDDEYLDYNPEN